MVADAITAVAEAVYLLQNNCTLLNQEYSFLIDSESPQSKSFFEIYGVAPDIDFCAIETFTPIILSIVTRFVNFTGYTGPVSFNYNTLFRNSKA